MTERGRTADLNFSGEHPGPSGAPGTAPEHSTFAGPGTAPEHRPGTAPEDRSGTAPERSELPDAAATPVAGGPPPRTGAEPPPGPAAGTNQRQSTGTLIARVLVVLLALTVIVLVGAGAVDATWQGAQADDRGKNACFRDLQTQSETLRAQLDAEVPPGSKVFLSSSLDSLWQLRLLEFAAMDGILVVTQHSQAEFTLSVAAVSKSCSPGGLRLVVTKDR